MQAKTLPNILFYLLFLQVFGYIHTFKFYGKILKKSTASFNNTSLFVSAHVPSLQSQNHS